VTAKEGLKARKMIAQGKASLERVGVRILLRVHSTYTILTAIDGVHSLHATIETISTFNATTLDILKSLTNEQPVGNRWFKVNLHVHGEGNDPAAVVKQARQAEIDILAITDHQSFACCDGIVSAANTPGRPLTILPGIEITSLEGVHVLGIFPQSFGHEEQTRLLGWLEIPGSGDTRIASFKKLSEIFEKIREEKGIVVVPHPFTDDIGMLGSARKLNIKLDWLESEQVGLIQIPKEKVHHVEWDENGNWINRYVLASANSVQIKSSSYCLAPFNRSDAHKADEIPDECSWFRMGEATVEGLKQAACEPKTRISRTPPPQSTSDAILAVRVNGGYSDGQCFRFNSALNCIVGQNYAGKSAVFDFVRYGLGLENAVEAKVRENLLGRLYGILGFGGNVELFVRKGGNYYAVKRSFNPVVAGSGPNLVIQSCPDKCIAYRFDPQTDSLEPTANFEFIVEVYEQGRISRLRADVGRQLDMLDEFAGIAELKRQRAGLVTELNLSAEALAPLYEEREQLMGAVAGLSQLQEELTAKEALMPGAEEQKWAKASAFVSQVETIQAELDQAAQNIPLEASNLEHTTDLDGLFGQAVPDLNADEFARVDLLSQMRDRVQTGLKKIEAARTAITTAIEDLSSTFKALYDNWQQSYAEHQDFWERRCGRLVWNRRRS
jgi:AAA domain-containing protein